MSLLRTGTVTHDNIFPVGYSQLSGVLLVQVENVEVLKPSRGAAGVLDLGPPPLPCQLGCSPGLDVHERLQQGVVIQGMVPGTGGQLGLGDYILG